MSYRRGRGRPWYVRWSVNGQERGPKTFPSEIEAEDYRARLLVASRDREKWDLGTGLPVSWNPSNALNVASFCRLYFSSCTKSLKPRSQAALAETLSRFVVATVPKRSAEMPMSYAELARWIQGSDLSKKAEDWLVRWTPLMSSLDKKTLERVHDALLVSVYGQLLGANVLKRRFTEVGAVLNQAVADGVLETNELKKPSRVEIEKRPPAPKRPYPSMSLMLEVMETIESHQPASRMYRAMTAIGILAGCRPSEIVALEMSDIELPEEGWGVLTVSHARTGLRGWSEDDQQIGQPKVARSRRSIPIHQRLVIELSGWIAFAEIEEGPLFRTRGGLMPTSSNWSRALNRATTKVTVRNLTPYDLRRFHGTWLAESGVPYNEAARRMGHDLAVFMSVYVGTTGDVEAVGNAALDRALS